MTNLFIIKIIIMSIIPAIFEMSDYWPRIIIQS